VKDLYNNKAQRLEECSNPPTSIENITIIEDPALVELIKEYQDVFVEMIQQYQDWAGSKTLKLNST